MKKVIFLISCFVIVNVVNSQNLTFQYQNPDNGTIVNFPTNSITSDFGTRNYPGSVWHKGIDYGAQLGVTLRSIEAGTVEKIKGTGFKYITIAGSNNFSYGHIFESNDGPIVSLGNFALITKQVNNQPRYAIINTSTSIAIGSNLNDIVSYDGVDYTVQSNITQNQGIAPLGTSSDGNPFPPHVHLYRLKNAASGIVDNNYLNPLQVVNHTAPSYTVSFETTNNRLFRLTPNTSSIYYAGNESSSVCIKVQMNSPGREGSTPNIRYSSATMDIEKVELFIKKDFETDEFYSLINGVTYQSRIEYGGMKNANGTFTNTYPANLSNSNQAFGSSTITGVDPHAYNDDDYDLFYFSDIFTRIEDGTTTGNFAECNKEALYPDGNYNLYARMTTILNNQFSNLTTPQAIKIDNFRPYIEKVEVRKNQNTENPVYTGSWSWSSNALNWNKSVTGTITANTPLFIKVYTSEPMQNVDLSAFGITTSSNTPVDATRKVWDFSIPAASVTTGSKTITIKSTSLDLAGNGIEGFIATSSLSGSLIPKHQNDGTWSPAANTRDDVVHSIDVIPATPVANFTGSPITLNIGYSVNFTDASSNNPTSWNWSFQGGSPTTSILQNPVINYYSAGEFNVSLTVKDATGNTSSITKSAYITVTNPPVCDFTMSASQITTGGYVTFTDVSTNNPTSRLWAFIGGIPSESNDPSIVVRYNSAGTYSITLQTRGPDDQSRIAVKKIVVVEPQMIISGTTYRGIQPTDGVLVRFDPDGWYTTSGADGFYSLSVPNNWSGTIKASKEGLSFPEQPVNPVTTNITINLHGTDTPPYMILYEPSNPVSGDLVKFHLNTIGIDQHGLWEFWDGTILDDEGFGKVEYPVYCSKFGNSEYEVKCTIENRKTLEKKLAIPVWIAIPRCPVIVAGADYTNGCSTIRLGETAFLTDVSSPYENLNSIQIVWDWDHSSWEKYWRNCYSNNYPESRLFSKVYTTKGHKDVKYMATSYASNYDVSWPKFNVVDCGTTVYSNTLLKGTYDNSDGTDKYFAGTMILGGSVGAYEANPDKTTIFTSCNEIVLKPGFHAKPNGDFYVQLLSNDPCLTSESKKIPQETNYSENSFLPIIDKEEGLTDNSKFNIFPNPTSNTLNIEYSIDVSRILSIEIINSAGELLLKKTNVNSNREELNVERFSPGVYCLRLVTTNKVLSKVFVKN